MSDDVTPEEDLLKTSISLKKAKVESATREGPDIGPTVCQDRGNRTNEILWTCSSSTKKYGNVPNVPKFLLRTVEAVLKISYKLLSNSCP